MPVAGVPAGAPAGAASGAPKGNPAGERTIHDDVDRSMGGSRGDSFGTTPVGGTIHAASVKVPRVRFVIRGIRSGAGTPDRATLNVMWQAGEPNARSLFEPTHPLFGGNTGDDGGLVIEQPGATFQTHPSLNAFSGRPHHSFSLAQRGGTVHTGTITTEIQTLQGR